MIDVDGITKKLGGETVLDRLSLRIRRGEIFALLGPNGVGKTTLLRCLVGLYVPIEGSITIDGLDRRRDHLAIRRFTAWLSDSPRLYRGFRGRRWLEMVADVYGVPSERRDRQIAELLEIFDLTELADEPVFTYSNGQTKKLAICGVLVTNARLYLLDEPFTGEIDPSGLAALKEILRGLVRDGRRTVVLSTQIAPLASEVVTRAGVLHQGRMAAVGTIEELQERYDATSLEEVLSAVAAKRPAESTRRFLDSLEL